MGDLSTNFSKWEIVCPCCALDCIDLRIIERLQVVRDIAGHPIKVLSGCRCDKHNKEVNGAEKSRHMVNPETGLTDAIDFTLSNLHKLGWLGNYLLDGWSGGFHYYEESYSIHIDLGEKRRWK